MDQVSALYTNYKNQNYFPVADTVIICALLEGGVMGLPDHLDIMRQSLQKISQNPIVRTYDTPPNINISGRGTVMVTSGPNRATVYVEDQSI